jgi:hypothetical protein
MVKIPIDFTGSFVGSGFSNIYQTEGFVSLPVSLGKASEWSLLLIVSAMFLGGTWLLFDEVLKSSKKCEEDFGPPPSGIVKFVGSVSRRFERQTRVNRTSSEKENRSAAIARKTPEKAA